VVAIGACAGKTATELVVAIDSDLEAGAIERVDVDLEWPGAAGVKHRYCGAHFPYSFGVVPAPGHGDSPLRVTARAHARGAVIVESTAQASFVDGKALLLRLDLQRGCAGVRCADSSTSCVDGVCREIQRSSLPGAGDAA